MITIKINNRIKVKEHLEKGLKIFVRLKISNKWICLKFNKDELELLQFIINAIRLNKNERI